MVNMRHAVVLAALTGLVLAIVLVSGAGLLASPSLAEMPTVIATVNVGTGNPSNGPEGVAIDTKHVKTEVLVENGGTVVIGGIYTQTVQENTQRIPFFGDLPYIGWLFKNREWIDDKSELLVFITPKIVADGLAIR